MAPRAITWPRLVDAPGRDLEILAQGIRRRIDEKILARADDAGKGEKEAELLRHDPLHAIIFLRDDVDVIASEDEELNDATNDIRRRLRARMTDDPVQRRLHRTGGNLEWLEEIGADADRDNDRHQDDFAVFPPMRFPGDGRELVQFGVERFRLGLDPFGVLRAQGRVEGTDARQRPPSRSASGRMSRL